MFFTRQKKITLEAYAPVGELINLFPIIKADTPNWFKKISANVNNGSNIKHCSGVKDLYKRGLMFPLWADYEIDISRTGVSVRSGMAEDKFKSADIHNLQNQASGLWPGYSSVKFNSPWYFWCSEPIEWVWVQPMWDQQHPQQLSLVPGISEYKYMHQTNINTLIRIPDKQETISLKAGTPMAHLIPLTEKDWDLKLIVMDSTAWATKFSPWSFSLGHALRYQKIKKIYNGN
jgi:hypothetical protein